MTDKEELELLMARVEEMRQAQREYFSSSIKSQTQQKIAIAKETELDSLVKQLRRRGYSPDRFKNRTEQKGLF